MKIQVLHLTTERAYDGTCPTACLACGVTFVRDSMTTKEVFKWNRSSLRCSTDFIIGTVATEPASFDPKLIKHLTVQAKQANCLVCNCDKENVFNRTKNQRAHGRDYFRCDAVRERIISIVKVPNV